MFTSVIIREMQNKITEEYYYKLTLMVKINRSEIPNAGETWSRGNFHSHKMVHMLWKTPIEDLYFVRSRTFFSGDKPREWYAQVHQETCIKTKHCL